VSICCFGWEGSPLELDVRQERLLQHLDAIPEEDVYVIGASAGGVAAMNLLQARPHIRKVVAIASPLRPKDLSTKGLLVEAFKQCDSFLINADDRTRRKILSVHGYWDNRVPVEFSSRPGIQSIGIGTIGHGSTILAGLTIRHEILSRFMREDEPQIVG
jgi:pimeloyl-ACP methyl ester carboxylesterase